MEDETPQQDVVQARGGEARLPVVGGPRPERADAARNRRRLMAAAERIMAERGVEGLLMGDVAEAAGVGVGTLYRRFGDRAGLARALLDEQGKQFQAAFMYGPPPLGPGAEPVERIGAFLHAWAEELDEQAALMLMADAATPPVARYQTGAYPAYRAHLLALIRRARPGADAMYLAEALLAPLAADLYVYQRREQGMSIERIKAGLDEVLRCLL